MSYNGYQGQDYGWSDAWPESKLTVGSQAGRAIPAHLKGNASLLSDFLAKIPFPITINSGYRSSSVNEGVGGSSSSQHTNALAVDIQPRFPMTNWMLGTWFWVYRPFFPELDQVITYTDKSHLHVGICPPGATGCVAKAPRKEFLVHSTGGYAPWQPSPADLAFDIANMHPLVPMSWLPRLAMTTAVAGLALVAMWRFRAPLKRRLGLK